MSKAKRAVWNRIKVKKPSEELFDGQKVLLYKPTQIRVKDIFGKPMGNQETVIGTGVVRIVSGKPIVESKEMGKVDFIYEGMPTVFQPFSVKKGSDEIMVRVIKE